jgi:hypothetical protein
MTVLFAIIKMYKYLKIIQNWPKGRYKFVSIITEKQKSKTKKLHTPNALLLPSSGGVCGQDGVMMKGWSRWGNAG